MAKRVPMKTGKPSTSARKPAPPRQGARRTDSMPKGYTCKTLSQR